MAQNYEKVSTEKIKSEDNEVRVTSKGSIKASLVYASQILQSEDHKELIITAAGNAIVKALILIELVKRKVGNLH